jgi:hypothetical protein
LADDADDEGNTHYTSAGHVGLVERFAAAAVGTTANPWLEAI